MTTTEGRALNDQERLFCEHYVKHFNGAEAARQAGYSEHTAAAIASRMLKRVNVSEKIRSLVKETQTTAKDTRVRIVEALTKMAFCDLTKIGTFTDAGEFNLRPVAELTDEATYPINEISRTVLKGGSQRLKVKLADRLKAIELLGRHIGMWDQDGSGDLPKPVIIELTNGEKIVLGARHVKEG